MQDGSVRILSRTILVAEDDPLTRMVLSDALRASGFEVIETASGAEALSVIEAGRSVDLLITDIQMPGSLDGNALARIVLKLLPAIKVIVAAGGAPDPKIASEIAGYYTKPYSAEAIAEDVLRLFEDNADAERTTQIA